jgi:tetratricopeptide (TPR) repeat protein
MIVELLIALGRWSDAERIAAQVVKFGTATAVLQPPRFITALRNQAEAIAVQGREAEACGLFHAAARLAEQFAEEVGDQLDHLTQWYKLELAAVLVSWATAAMHMYETEVACEMLREARSICFQCSIARPHELADCLANLGEAFRIAGKPYEAELALGEALDVVTRSPDEPRAIHILGILGRLGSERFDAVNDYARIVRDAEKAEASGRFGAAYVRWCICSEIASRAGDDDRALAAIARAHGLELHLDAADLNPAKLRIAHARVLRHSGSPTARITAALLEGAHLWFGRLARPFLQRDFIGMAFELHENFRMLARALFDDGRSEESVLAFEAGRALAHCMQVDSSYRDRVIARNPFSSRVSIDLSVLRDAQASLGEGDVAVSIAVLPPEVVAYVIDRERVTTCAVPVPAEESEKQRFAMDLDAIPTRLREHIGSRAIPSILLQLGCKIKSEIGDRRAVALLPYGTLHIVPWRAVLRSAGISWSQLPATTEFGLLMRSGRSAPVSSSNAVALGFGDSGNLDLSDEARTFAKSFGARGSVVSPCSSTDLVRALETDAIVLVSCHGDVDAPGRERANLDDGELVLHLRDGAHRAKTLIPERVRSSLIILSACESGVYRMAHGDFPAGAAPDLLRAGARHCIGARFPILSRFAASFMPALGRELAAGVPVARAFAKTNEAHESSFDLWRDLACLELVGV